MEPKRRSSRSVKLPEGIHRLHTLLRESAFERLVRLQSALEVASETEVIRRALIAYDELKTIPDSPELTLVDGSEPVVRESYIRLPVHIYRTMCERKKDTGLAFDDQIHQALILFENATRERDDLAKKG